jgi:lysophospholipase L1-like esterase
MRTRANADGAAASSPSGGPTLLTFLLPILLVVAVVAVNAVFFILKDPASRLTPHYYVALGDSLTFGFQPDLDLSDGFADDLFTALRPASVTDLENFACGGETSTTMIHGGCTYRFATHVRYSGPQLDAATNFISAHRGQVSPITLEIGANDVLPDFNKATCTASPAADADLALLDTNLTQTILPRLMNALTTPAGHPAADLVLLNYYNPFAKSCPNSQEFIHLLNTHLATDAAQFRIPVVDIYSAFGGDNTMAANICTYTWTCSSYNDIHPTIQGYRLMAAAIQQVLGYANGSIPNPANTPAPPPASN